MRQFFAEVGQSPSTSQRPASATPCYLCDDYIPVTQLFGYCTCWMRFTCASETCEEAR